MASSQHPMPGMRTRSPATNWDDMPVGRAAPEERSNAPFAMHRSRSAGEMQLAEIIPNRCAQPLPSRAASSSCQPPTGLRNATSPAGWLQSNPGGQVNTCTPYPIARPRLSAPAAPQAAPTTAPATAHGPSSGTPLRNPATANIANTAMPPAPAPTPAFPIPSSNMAPNPALVYPLTGGFDSARTALDSARESVNSACSSSRKGASRVQVFVRVRPFLGKEHLPTKDVPVVKCCVEIQNNVASCLDPADGYTRKEGYKFDRCFWSFRGSAEHGGAHLRTETQCDVYTDIGNEMLDNMFQGFNTCMFCYGQTGSGKTYTMMGKLSDREERGVIPRLCEDMFWRIKNAQRTSPSTTFTVEASYFEIYNEKVRDLLRRSEGPGPNHSVDLKVRQHPEKGPYVEGLSTHLVDDLAAVFFLMQRGSEERTTSSTYMNDVSSRSHAIFTITFAQVDANGAKVSKMNLVDLAGSERTSMIDSARHFKESTNINMSLTTLGRVIDALVERNSKQVLPPYRDSALTWLLSDSLGGNSRTFMMATVSPSPASYEETLSTLRYSSRARKIINQTHINTMDDNNPIIKSLREEVNWLRTQLELSGNNSARDSALQQQLSESEAEIKRLRLQLMAIPAEPPRSKELEIMEEENRQLRSTLERERQLSSRHIAALNERLEAQRAAPPQRPPMPQDNPQYSQRQLTMGEYNPRQQDGEFAAQRRSVHRTASTPTVSAVHGQVTPVYQQQRPTTPTMQNQSAMQAAQEFSFPPGGIVGEIQSARTNRSTPIPDAIGAGRSRTPLAAINGMVSRSPGALVKGPLVCQNSVLRGLPHPEVPTFTNHLTQSPWNKVKPLAQYPPQGPDTEVYQPNRPTTPMSRPVDSAQRSMSPPITRMALIAHNRSVTPRARAPYFGMEVDLDADPSIRGVSLLGAHGPAAEAGIQAGDVIISVGNKAVIARDDLKAILFSAQPGDVLTVHVLRGQELVQCLVRAGCSEDQIAQPSPKVAPVASPVPHRSTTPVCYNLADDDGTPPPIRRIFGATATGYATRLSQLGAGQIPSVEASQATQAPQAAITPQSHMQASQLGLKPVQPGSVDAQGRRIIGVVERAYLVDAQGKQHEIEEENPFYPITTRSAYNASASVARSHQPSVLTGGYQ